VFSSDVILQVKYHVDKSPAAKGFEPMEVDGGAQRESFGMGNDYTEPEQHAVKVAPAGSFHLNQWPDKVVPEFRKVLYEYCKCGVPSDFQVDIKAN
jgi:isopenicillin N synthase-like dioxygenase